MARILFIDDDPFTLETFTKAVELIGHLAIVANSGEQGLELAKNQSPDLIFIDLMLPDIDGFAVLTALQSEPETAGIPAFLLTAGPEADIAEQARAAGARDFISKPIRLQTLLAVINQYTPTT